MNKVTLSTLLLIASLSGFGQCGMTVTMAVNPICGFGSISVNTTGGTAPYTIVVETHYPFGSWTNSQTLSGSLTGDLTNYPFGSQLDRKDQARVTVTDATNCVATNTAPAWQPTYQQIAHLTHYVDCAAGISTLEFVATDMGSPPPALSTWTYQLDLSGPIASFQQNWTALPGTSPQRYRYNTNVGAGLHTVTMPNVNTPTWYYCGAYAQGNTTQPITPGDCGANIAIRGALQAALPSGTLMQDSLRTKGLVPTSEPYAALGYAYTAFLGSSTIPPTLLATTGNNAIVDWVVVELRSSANAAQVLFSRPALIQRDGDLVDLDGDGYVNFPSAVGNYYVALRHRNHLSIMTGAAQNLAVTPNTIDFRLSSTACYGTNARTAVGTVMCLWSGDANGTGNGNGALSYTGNNNDRDPILTAIGGTTPNNTLTNQYSRLDVNMDGVVKYTGLNNDRDPILTNIGSTTPNNTRAQQLP